VRGWEVLPLLPAVVAAACSAATRAARAACCSGVNSPGIVSPSRMNLLELRFGGTAGTPFLGGILARMPAGEYVNCEFQIINISRSRFRDEFAM
jgi:hypothetical protein